MTVNTSNNRIEYSGNGATTVFAYNFRILDPSHVEVILVSSAGVETVQTITTHYTVAGVGDAGGGDITMVTAPASGESLVFRRSMPFTQNTDYTSGDPFAAETHEQALDERVMETQEIKEVVDRALVAPKQEGSLGSLPNVAARQDKMLAFDGGGVPKASSFTEAEVQTAINAQVAGTAAGSTSAITHDEDSTTYNLATYLQNRHVVNVKDFGAVGDGVVDDSAAIQSAITSAPAGSWIVGESTDTYNFGTITGDSIKFSITKELHFDWRGAKLLCAGENDSGYLSTQLFRFQDVKGSFKNYTFEDTAFLFAGPSRGVIPVVINSTAASVSGYEIGPCHIVKGQSFLTVGSGTPATNRS